MHVSNSLKTLKTLSALAGVTCLVNLGGGLFSQPAYGAVLNGTFESGNTGWNFIGDSSVQPSGTVSGTSGPISAIDTAYAVITTACPGDSAITGGDGGPTEVCEDEVLEGQARNDDPNGNKGDFNFTGNDQVRTDVSPTLPGPDRALQNFLGIPEDSLDEDFLETKEGSGLLSDPFTKTSPFTVSFQFDFLTNDGLSFFGDPRDLAFVTLYEVSSDIDTRTIIPLERSTGDPSFLAPGETAYQDDFIPGFQTFVSPLLPPGTYVIGFGVVDQDEVGLSSVLLIDNVQAIPFEKEAMGSAGLLGAIAFIGLRTLRQRSKRSEINL